MINFLNKLGKIIQASGKFMHALWVVVPKDHNMDIYGCILVIEKKVPLVILQMQNAL